MEIFIFPELMYSLVLANLMSPRIWQWRNDPWFNGIKRQKPLKRLQRLRQYIMDRYVFNLDLATWGLTTRERELDRFEKIIDPAALAQSNALFGYEGDKYYFDIDIRTHFGLDKYSGNVIPYWKTETVEAMDAFIHRPGFTTGAGECVSLAALYAAALFIVAGIPLDDIFLMATPLHSQNFVDIDDGVLINNRRLVTKSMWFNGTPLSGQARRALENERVTVVTHRSGHIHTLYDNATIDQEAYKHFSARLTEYLYTNITPEILGNFLRQAPDCQSCFVVRETISGVDRYVALDKLFTYEQQSNFKVTNDTRAKLLAEVPREEYALSYGYGKLVLNDLESFVARGLELRNQNDVNELKRRFGSGCLNAGRAIEELLAFCQVKPRLPDLSRVNLTSEERPIKIDGNMSREEIIAHISDIAPHNRTAALAFYAYRDLGRVPALPFLIAAMQRNPVTLDGSKDLDDKALINKVSDMPNISIYDDDGRLAQPDEIWIFGRGDGLERIILIAMVLRERHRQTDFIVHVENGKAELRHGDRIVCALPTNKVTLENKWELSEIALRDL